MTTKKKGWGKQAIHRPSRKPPGRKLVGFSDLTIEELDEERARHKREFYEAQARKQKAPDG